MPNHLIAESSPYLQQHAHNPVDWYPWGDAAFAVARAQDKPILLSVGYATCHWCHVMARESFEDETTAALMNAHFINIKLDREERPDIDAIYMQALQMMQGNGGWPMTVVMTPQGVPFFAGTYFPKVARYGQPAFTTVLQALADAWQQERQAILRSAGQVHQQLRALMEQPLASTATELPQAHWLSQALAQLVTTFDERCAGFGDAPKFPPHGLLRVLLSPYPQYQDAMALQLQQQGSVMAHKTLQAMARGGIYDQLAGGFCRYSVDACWQVPHFEKMLYDNAQLLSAYSLAYVQQPQPDYARVVKQTIDWLNAEMQAPGGGFYAARDADSEGVEGKYYRWSEVEVDALLAEDAALAKAHFGITMVGNFEGYNVLQRQVSPEVLAEDYAMPRQEVEQRLESARQRLQQARAQRVAPATDRKRICSWNALLLRGLAEAAQAFGRQDWLEQAHALADWLQQNFWQQGRLYRIYNPQQTAVRIPGLLEDYAYTINGLLALYASSLESHWLLWGLELAEQMVATFYDAERESFYSTPADGEQLIVRPRELFDQAMPSSSAAAVQALGQLARYSGNSQWDALACQHLQQVAPLLARSPLAMGESLHLLQHWLNPPREALLVCKQREDAAPWLARLRPVAGASVLVVISDEAEDQALAAQLALAQGRSRTPTQTVCLYLCSQGVCQRPLQDIQELEPALARWHA